MRCTQAARYRAYQRGDDKSRYNCPGVPVSSGGSGPPSCRHVAGCHDDTCPRVHTLVTWSHANHVSPHNIAACWPLHLSMLYPHTSVYIRALNEPLRSLTLPREGSNTHYSKQVLKHGEYRCEIGTLICKDHNYNRWL